MRRILSIEVPKHARADVAGPNRNHQRDKWPLLNKKIKRIRRAVAFDSRLVAEASDTLFNLAGGGSEPCSSLPLSCAQSSSRRRASPREDPRETAQARKSAFIGGVIIAKSPKVARHKLRRDDYV